MFGSKTKNNSEFRFHVGLLNDFIDHMDKSYISRDLYTVRRIPLYDPVKIKANLKPGWVLKNFQETGKRHIMNHEIPGYSRLISFATGAGKTVTSLATIAAIKNRLAIIILPTYVDKWCSDLMNILDLKVKDIMTVQGGDQLKGVISLADDNALSSSVLIISMVTLQNYYKLYEADPDAVEEMGYMCQPEDLFKKLGVGTVLVDETHQHVNSVHRTMMFTHVPLWIALSATLLTLDPVVQKIHEAMYPKEARFEGEKMEKYIRLYPVEYRFKDIDQSQIRTTEFGSTNYSHNAFERSLLKTRFIKTAYYRMIEHLIKLGYLQDKQPGDKLIIFAASIAMCTDLVAHLKSVYTSLDIRRYVEDDPYENVIDADIRVSTVQSSGTAVDIPNLTCAIQTVCIASQVSNLQSLGRLRKLKDREVRFYYTYCAQIPKHLDYHLKRIELFRDRVATIKDSPYPYPLT